MSTELPSCDAPPSDQATACPQISQAATAEMPRGTWAALAGAAALALAGCGSRPTTGPASLHRASRPVVGLSANQSVLHAFAGGPMDGQWPRAALTRGHDGTLYGTTIFGGAHGDGAVFRISPTGTESILHSFAGPGDGRWPRAALILDHAGNLYGTTSGGGAHGNGTVFRISAAGAATILHSFAASSRSAEEGSWASLLRDRAGNLYGTTFFGGTKGDGTVFRISRSGREVVLHSFAGAPTDGAEPAAGLTRDNAGFLYGTTERGGAHRAGTVFRISAAGTETVLYSFRGGRTDGALPQTELTMDRAGNLYGTTFAGGPNNDGAVFRISPGGTETVLHFFVGAPTDGAEPAGGLVMDSTGNLYGTTTLGGAYGDGTVFTLSTAGAERVLSSFAGPVGGQWPRAALIIDRAGNLYGTTAGGGTHGNGTVFKIKHAGRRRITHRQEQ